jgi:hypothetical protein
MVTPMYGLTTVAMLIGAAATPQNCHVSCDAHNRRNNCRQEVGEYACHRVVSAGAMSLITQYGEHS